VIYTGYFEQLSFYVGQGLTPICIAGYPPEGFTGIRFRTMAPKKIWWREWHEKHLSNDWYEQKYNETVLKKLDPLETAKKLQSYGQNVVLLCWEKPPEFCHRHLVAKWMNWVHIPVCEYTRV